ncbi:DUF2291 family protein [Vibrio salinus]|uniref:DUF2291 family protein n=1 Tax=Vibrio salinus TaxID=2899784 RepID=UPI001E590EBA|nr:DUF2291 family protein [Vibrio salinus]MCE0495984.1 DUF2291 domain-containing protein [Vibrio salinus]
MKPYYFSNLLLSVFVGLILTGCDVVKLDDNGNPIIPMTAEEAHSIKNMSPKQLADRFWGDIIKEANGHSKNLDSVSDRKSQFVSFQGIVNSVDDSSMRATMDVVSGQKNIVLQIGPIVRGNSVRDASSFINFDDFKNQVQFARLSKELNKKAMANFTRPDSSWKGSKVDVLAAVTYKGNSITDVIPLKITKR